MKTRLRVLRAEMEWSQADLAERLGVSRQTINAIETGKYESGLPLAIRIARLFGKAVEEVFLLGVEPLTNGPSERDPCRRNVKPPGQISTASPPTTARPR